MDITGAGKFLASVFRDLYAHILIRLTAETAYCFGDEIANTMSQVTRRTVAYLQSADPEHGPPARMAEIKRPMK